MISIPTITLTLERRLLEHPRAFHLRRMRLSLWLYLELLARMPKDGTPLVIEPREIGEAMGLSEGTIRSWLGHLKKAGYISAERLNSAVRISVNKGFVPEPPAALKERAFTVRKLQRALGDKLNVESFEAALKLYPDDVIQRALAGALAPPEDQIRRSRTALFLYLLKHQPHV